MEVVAEPVDDTRLSVHWRAPLSGAPITGYTVHVRRADAPPEAVWTGERRKMLQRRHSSTATALDVGATTHAIMDKLEPDTNYTVRVAAMVQRGVKGVWSAMAYAKTDRPGE